MQMKLIGWMIGLVLSTSTVVAQTQQPPTPPRVGILEKLGTTIPLDDQLYDEQGMPVTLRSVINKPTILVPVYYRCSGLCTPMLNEVSKVIRKMDLTIGKDYQVVTVSFDPTETPDIAADKKDTYLSNMEKPIDPKGWRFFTGDSANVRRLTDAVGFYYEPAGKDWVHPSALIALSPTGEITRYLYGVNQLPLDVKLAIMEASQGKTGPTIAKVLNFCYTYDPEGKHYAFNVVRVSGVVIVGLVAIFVFVFVIRPRKKGGQPS